MQKTATLHVAFPFLAFPDSSRLGVFANQGRHFKRGSITTAIRSVSAERKDTYPATATNPLSHIHLSVSFELSTPANVGGLFANSFLSSSLSLPYCSVNPVLTSNRSPSRGSTPVSLSMAFNSLAEIAWLLNALIASLPCLASHRG